MKSLNRLTIWAAIVVSVASVPDAFAATIKIVPTDLKGAIVEGAESEPSGWSIADPGSCSDSPIPRSRTVRLISSSTIRRCERSRSKCRPPEAWRQTCKRCSWSIKTYRVELPPETHG